jgi:hypothetical protein
MGQACNGATLDPATLYDKKMSVAYKIVRVTDLATWEFYTSKSTGIATYEKRPDLVDKLVIRTDTVAVGKRPAVRLMSPWRIGNPGSWFEATVSHQPLGCGYWPALWLRTPGNTSTGWDEIDMVESINVDTNNIWNIHTKGLCYMNGMNCTYPPPVGRGGAIGCQGFLEYPSPQKPIKYRLEFFENEFAFSVNDVEQYRMDKRCSSFKDMQIIIKIDFCGNWASRNYQDCNASLSYPSLGCEYDILNRPEQSVNAYWEFTDIKARPNSASLPGSILFVYLLLLKLFF